MSSQKQSNIGAEMTFWEHVEVLRKVIFRCIGVWFFFAIAAFCLKDQIFSVIFAPSRSDFVLYTILCRISAYIGIESLCPEDFKIMFINTELASQFMVHLQMSACVGLVFALPYLVFELYGFVSPALYDNERHYSFSLIFFSFFLFFTGVLLNYFVIFPFSFRFLSTYQVNADVVNQIALSSYTSTFLLLSVLLGLLFEIPIVAYFLAKLNVINADMLRKYRKHAIVVICILAAIITPTADIFTLLLVALPIFLLYECSIFIVKNVNVN